MNLCHKIKAAYLRVRNWEATTVYQRIAFFTGIVAFVSATQYLSAKPSLEIHLSKVGVIADRVLLQRFYRDTGVDIPQTLVNHTELGSLFWSPESQEDATTVGRPSSSNHLRELLAIPPTIEGVIPEYERLLALDVWPNVISSIPFPQGVPMEVISKLLPRLKTQLTPRDYRDFVAAVLYSRVFIHVMSIKNDGDLDLRSLLIIVPSPLTMTSDSRDNNILLAQGNNTHLCDITNYQNRIEIRIPELKKRHGMGFTLHARENAIRNEEIVSSFDAIKSSGNPGLIYLLVAFVMLVVYLLCKGTKARPPT